MTAQPSRERGEGPPVVVDVGDGARSDPTRSVTGPVRLAGELLAAGLVLRVSPRSAGTTPPDTGPFTITLGKAEVIATLEIADDGV
jgi:hypothetical protein